MVEVEIINDCVSCDHCISCGKDRTPYAYFYCDSCGDEKEELFVDDDGNQLCLGCLLEKFDKIDDSNFEQYVDGYNPYQE